MKLHKNIEIIFLAVSKTGSISLADLDKELSKDDVPTLVSLMHANNELGTLLDLEKVAEICQKHKAYLHIDTVQTMGHLPFNLKAIPVHFITAAAHKFHGLKGSGFLYKKENISSRTVEADIDSMKRRFSIQSLPALVAFFMRNGWIK